MQTVADRPEAPNAIRTDLGAIFISLELSRSTWLITSLSPYGGEKMSKHAVRGGDVAGLLERFAQLRKKARATAARYAAVRQSLGEPDPFRLRHRAALREIIGEVVRGRMDKKAAVAHVAAWAQGKIDAGERDRFREIAEGELLGLHEGNFARYQIRPSEFEAWQKLWNASP